MERVTPAVFFTIALLLSAHSRVNAQVDFCVLGATWLYVLEGNQGVNNHIQSKVEYVGDTLFAGSLEAKVLRNESRWQSFTNGPVQVSITRQYITQQNDSVFYYRDGEWEFSFDLAAEADDQWVTYIGGSPECPAHDTMHIQNMEWEEHFNLTLKTMHYRLLAAYEAALAEVELAGTSEGRYLERVGHLVGHPVIKEVECHQGITEYMAMNLVCYTDYELTVLHPEINCAFSLFPVGVEEQHAQQGLIYTDGIVLLSWETAGTLTVHDLLGREVHREEVAATDRRVDLRSLREGVVLISLHADDGNASWKRVLHGR